MSRCEQYQIFKGLERESEREGGEGEGRSYSDPLIDLTELLLP